MSKSTAYNRLPGAENLKARKLYIALVDHRKAAACPICDSYPQYGTLIIRGSLFEHIEDIADFKIEKSDFAKLMDRGLITIEKVAERKYRITFVELAKELEKAEKTA